MSFEQLLRENEIAQPLIVTASAHSLLLHANGKITSIKSALLQDAEAARTYDKGQTHIDREYNIKQVAADYLTSFALREDGTVTYAGEAFPGIEKVKTYRNVVAIACGVEHFAALKTDGTVVACGNNDNGQCNVAGWNNIKKIACNCSATFGLKDDGTVVACGHNSTGICNVSHWENIVNIFASMNFAIGVKADGTLVSSGELREHTKKTIAGWTDVVALGGSGDEFLALKADGTAYYCDEFGDESAVSSWNNLVAVAFEGGIAIGLQRDGNVIALQNRSGYIQDFSRAYNGVRLFDNIETFYQERETAFAEESERRAAAAKLAKRKQRTKIIIRIVLVAALLAGLAYGVFVAAPAFIYNKGVAYMESGDYGSALDWLCYLNNYQDSEKHIAFCKAEKKKQDTLCQLENLASAKEGDVITFGFYEQDNNLKNGEEEIEWIVLAKRNNQILVISKQVLDAAAYDIGDEAYSCQTWETSALRERLNTSFYNAAFPEELQGKIVTNNLKNPGNDTYGTKGGNATTDKVFLFSIDDATKYLSSSTDRRATATKWAEKTYGSDAVVQWQLRSSCDGDEVVVVAKGGNFTKVSPTEVCGIRPVLWLTVGK